ncbi:hypothetical protein K2173_012572 [Erythroxylum novogranatense]|uniref:Uncharacterized protein n=1 Tax=Erythroxylum novogranatense TaxID=1862640 RepID=A0AAV8TLR6_9ROSI|nr:hypothetical protein K2173_012572 [Erythroxylum novogranatense]
MDISPKKLVKMARKWQRLAVLKRKRLTIPGNEMKPVADKGHFAAYTTDQKRFVFPIFYLNSPIFKELLIMSEEEFGLPGNGPLRLACDAVFMEYAVSLIRAGVGEEMEKALVMSMASRSSRCSFSYSLHRQNQPENQSSAHYCF